MKYAWKTLTVLMIASPCHVLADANTPTDDVVKQQFAEQTGGIMRLQNVTLKQLDAREIRRPICWKAIWPPRKISIFASASREITFL